MSVVVSFEKGLGLKTVVELARIFNDDCNYYNYDGNSEDF